MIPHIDTDIYLGNAKILLTGAGGFFGQNLFPRLKDSEVHVLTRHSECIPDLPNVKIVQLPQPPYTHLIYMAMDVQPVALFVADSIPSKVFVSSGAVFGHGGNESYIRTKRDLEALCLTNEWKVARGWTHYGPHMHLNATALGNFIHAGLRGEKIVVKGPDTIRSYQYIQDSINALLMILIYGQRSMAYNIGSASPITLRRLAEIVARKCSTSVVEVGHEQSYYVPDLTKINQLFTMSETPLDPGLDSTIKWFKDNKAGRF